MASLHESTFIMSRSLAAASSSREASHTYSRTASLRVAWAHENGKVAKCIEACRPPHHRRRRLLRCCEPECLLAWSHAKFCFFNFFISQFMPCHCVRIVLSPVVPKREITFSAHHARSGLSQIHAKVRHTVDDVEEKRGGGGLPHSWLQGLGQQGQKGT